jgi:uncharacterized protein YdbL (DUF1318 family)
MIRKGSPRTIWRAALLGLLGLALSAAPAFSSEGVTELQVNSAAVEAIKKSMAGRYLRLHSHFQDGVIGYTQDGMIALREAASLARELRTELESLIAEDNKERDVMYREIARANGRPDWESRFRSVFAERWISRAPVGWYYRNASGEWVRKLPPAS